jgi:death on curing protein
MTLPFGNLRGDGQAVSYLTDEDLVELHRAVSMEFSGAQGHPGVVASDYGLHSAVERPKATIFGRDAYPTFYEKAAAFFFALLQNLPFESANQRAAVVALMAFCELNGREINTRILDDRTLEHLVRRAATYREKGVPPEEVFSEIRQIFSAAITPA